MYDAHVQPTPPEHEPTTRARFAWCLYDFANSAFPTVALTAFGAPYFEKVLVGERGIDLGPLHLGGSSAWGFAISTSMILVTLSSPLTGAIADKTGLKKRFLAIYSLLCIAATAAIGFLGPGAGLLALFLYVLANFAFEGAYVFYNAFLPALAKPEKVGRLSGYAWAFGYVGGLGALVAVKSRMPHEYSPEHAAGSGIIYWLIAAWFAAFGVPALLWLKTPQKTGSAVSLTPRLVRESFSDVARLLAEVRRDKALFAFLIAYFLYTDALTTVIEFTGVFTSRVLHFSPPDNVTLFLVLNIVAAPGAVFFGWLVDRIGAKRGIAWTLVLWCLVVVGAASTRSKAEFWPVAVLAAIVLGATQSASRTFMAKAAPPDKMAAYMGLLSLVGKASAVLGPIVYGVVADNVGRELGIATGHRVAIATMGSFFVLAWFVLRRVPEDKGAKPA